MVKRVAAFFAACLIAVASLSLTVCELLCASHQRQPAVAHAHHHSCAPSSTFASIAALPHACGHGDSDSVAVVQAIDISLMVAIVPAATLWTTASDVRPRVVIVRPTEYPPPGLLVQAIQLRV